MLEDCLSRATPVPPPTSVQVSTKRSQGDVQSHTTLDGLLHRRSLLDVAVLWLSNFLYDVLNGLNDTGRCATYLDRVQGLNTSCQAWASKPLHIWERTREVLTLALCTSRRGVFQTISSRDRVQGHDIKSERLRVSLQWCGRCRSVD